jgi:glycosyltransferase involved in cell wall biosynthesis
MDVVAFPFHDWRKAQRESLRTRDGHLIRELGTRGDVGQVLVVDRPVSLAERLRTRRVVAVDGERIAERRLPRGWTATVTRVGPRTVVLDIGTPDVVGPARDPRGWWFDVFADPRLASGITWALEATGARLEGVVAWTPTAVGTIEALRPPRFVFDSLDNWITHPVLRRHAARAEDAYRRLLPLADLVLAPSAATRTELAVFAADVVVLPNGVDLERFQHPGPRPADVPPSPTVGYVGKLGVRLDVGLVADTAQALPDVAFPFVGPALEPSLLDPLRGLPNVEFLGDRPVERVPDYLAAFDVAWIPHRVGEGETGGDLMKKYEYWAAGRQVVTTPVADLDAWVSQLHVVRSASEAVSTIRGLLDGSIAPTPTTVPPDRTWSAIAGELRALLELSPANASPPVDAV